MTLVLDQGESNIVLITIEYINNWEKQSCNKFGATKMLSKYFTKVNYQDDMLLMIHDKMMLMLGLNEN